MGRILRAMRGADLQARLDAAVEKEKSLDAEIKELTAKKKALDVEIQGIMSDMGSTQQRSGLFTVYCRPTAAGQRFDYPRYQKEHPDLCAAYMVATDPGLYFRIM